MRQGEIYWLHFRGLGSEPAGRRQRSEFGGDVKWGVTPSLTADFSINTDFAQEEVDVQQINFTRFSLFFPEKRQFFLEGERMFQFGIRKKPSWSSRDVSVYPPAAK